MRTTSLATTGAVHISASSICADTDNNTGQGVVKFDLFIKMKMKFDFLIFCNNQLRLMFTADGYLHFYRVTISNTGNEVVQVIGR